MRSVFATVALLARVATTGAVALLLSAAAAFGQEPSREGSVRRELHVGRVEIDAHVTGKSGDPVPGLTAADFVVKIDGRLAVVESAEWIPAERSEGGVEGDDVPAEVREAAAEAAARLSGGETPAFLEEQGPRYAPGRLLVFFFQTDHHESRLTGLLRMAQQATRLLDTLLPTDRVAVLSYDSQLKLRQDFTDDRKALSRAIFEAIKTGPAVAPDPSRFPSLGERYDVEAARRAPTVERGLAITSEALGALPGAKSLLYFGWGLGLRRHTSAQKDWSDAMRALTEARTTFFALDVTDADYHTLETTLMNAAELTGGTYEKTHVFPSLALRRVARAISGRYVLVVIPPAGATGLHAVDVSLAPGVKGRVFARAFYDG